MIKSSPLAQPQNIHMCANTVTAGKLIPPIERLRIFSPSEWEDFVLEYAASLQQNYNRVERCGGAGDMRRDVIDFVTVQKDSEWDNYQCKNYKVITSSPPAPQPTSSIKF